ncbi:DNA primase, partial [Candidatus Daviesbacteria bacterium]|nr:DNA primase [Candidatus Daviesbacteria bacterium]
MDDLDLIKQRVNVVDLIQEYLPLKKAGVNFKASCPFHQEKTPSFMVSPERQIWHCFGCGKGGDIFKFLMEKEGMTFPEALEMLAKKAGVVLTRRQEAGEGKDRKQRLFDANTKAAEFFHFILTKHQLGKAALDYLHKRGLTAATIEEFNLGYAPNSWESLTNFLLKHSFKTGELIEAGLVVPSKSSGYDRFRGRIIFPLISTRNQIVGFSGRVLDSAEPKYINTPQTPVFDKSSYLFGLNLAKAEIKNRNQAVLTEGEMDMILSYQAGVKNVVASKGTALTAGQIELIKKYTDTILLCFDMDLAGDSASRRGIEMADTAGLNIKVIQVPDGKDPAELVVKDVKQWLRAVDGAEPIYDYYLRSVSTRFDPKGAEGKKRIGAELVPIWAKISDNLTREHYIQKLAALLEVEESVIRDEIKTQNLPINYKNILTQPKAEVDSRSDFQTRRERLEEYLLALLFRIPAELTYVPSFPETVFLSESLRSLYVLLVLYLDAISFKAKSFEINEFIKTIPQDQVSEVDKLYLIEIDERLTSPKIWLDEVEKVVAELKKALVKASLEKLSKDIKNAQTFGKIELLETLN